MLQENGITSQLRPSSLFCICRMQPTLLQPSSNLPEVQAAAAKLCSQQPLKRMQGRWMHTMICHSCHDASLIDYCIIRHDVVQFLPVLLILHVVVRSGQLTAIIKPTHIIKPTYNIISPSQTERVLQACFHCRYGHDALSACKASCHVRL